MKSYILTNRDTIIRLSRKHCGKRRNCSFRAISSFPTMFFKSCMLLMCLNEYLWSEGLTIRKKKYGSCFPLFIRAVSVYLAVLSNCVLFFLVPVRCLNSFPNDKSQDSSKLKKSANDNFIFDGNGGEFSKRVVNTVGKGEIAHYEQFLLFPQCFQKTCAADT